MVVFIKYLQNLINQYLDEVYSNNFEVPLRKINSDIE
jgi:hypothetical protein